MKDVDWNNLISAVIGRRIVILRMKDVDWNWNQLYKGLKNFCHPSYEGCGLKFHWCNGKIGDTRHPSYEGCGLKYKCFNFRIANVCHPSYEGCGLKCNFGICIHKSTRHPSYEGCGLKSSFWYQTTQKEASSFVWRMWIEINISYTPPIYSLVILRMKDVDWNCDDWCCRFGDFGHPSYEGCGLKFVRS